MGQDLIDKHQCADGSDEAVKTRLSSITKKWKLLSKKTDEKSMKLKEADKMLTYMTVLKDLGVWLEWLRKMESLLTSEDAGKDLASVQNLMKEYQLVDSNISVCIHWLKS